MGWQLETWNTRNRNIYHWFLHLIQNQNFFGLLATCRPTHLKWCHSRQLSHSMHSAVAVLLEQIGQFHICIFLRDLTEVCNFFQAPLVRKGFSISSTTISFIKADGRSSGFKNKSPMSACLSVDTSSGRPITSRWPRKTVQKNVTNNYL